VEAI